MERELWKPGNLLYPAPVVMVSCKRPDEKANIITIAWTGTICSDPAMLSISIRHDRYSYDIINETKEFVVNLVDKDLAYACDWCGVKSGRDFDKFKEMNLTEKKSVQVAAPTIAESPVGIECVVKDVIALGSHDMFVSEVKAITVDPELMDENGKFCLEKAGLIAYSHGEYYSLGDYIGKFGYSVAKKK